jgi:antitoxin (DNA-binding transcriptional repressor) of toxin-antitoxin stability system
LLLLHSVFRRPLHWDGADCRSVTRRCRPHLRGASAFRSLSTVKRLGEIVATDRLAAVQRDRVAITFRRNAAIRIGHGRTNPLVGRTGGTVLQVLTHDFPYSRSRAAIEARPSEYLRAVRGGEMISVLDRDTPVAQLVPIRGQSPLRVRKPARGTPPPNRVRLPKPAKLDLDIVQLLLEERQASVIAYIDASELLRVSIRQPDALTEWREVEQGVSSALVTTESLRTLDRRRLRANLADAEGGESSRHHPAADRLFRTRRNRHHCP